MASTQHKDLVGDDLHVSKIDPDTGTELTPPSLVILDTRYINEGQAAGGDLSGSYPNPTVVWNDIRDNVIARCLSSWAS